MKDLNLPAESVRLSVRRNRMLDSRPDIVRSIRLAAAAFNLRVVRCASILRRARQAAAARNGR